MKWTRTVLTGLLALSTLTTAAMATPPQVMNILINPYAKGIGRPVAVAHRGVFMTGGPCSPKTPSRRSRAAIRSSAIAPSKST